VCASTRRTSEYAMKKRSRKFTRLKVVAVAEDEATREFIVVIDFRDIDGQIRRLELPKSSLRKIDCLKDALDNAGAQLPTNDHDARDAIRALSKSANNAERWKYAPTVGWYDGHRVFVLPDRIIGRPRGNARLLPPRRHNNHQRFELTKKGKHKDWVRSIAKPARYSSSMVLGNCIALAAPLLDFLDFHSSGILLSEPSKAGKSTALVVAGSVIGFAGEEHLPNFRTTDAGFGELPAAFNDMVMPINELGLLKGGTRERYERVRDLAYGFAEGRGTTYSKFVPHDGNRGAEWRSLGFGSGEETIDQIALAAGETRSMGESIRWIDLPVTSLGAPDIFDRCPKTLSADDRIKWASQQCQRLRRAAADDHGVAFEHYITQVIKNRRKISAQVQPLIEEFVQAVVDPVDDPAVQHLASCFGIIRAGGILGARFGTLPYSEKFIGRCIKRCYRAARRGLRTDAELLRSALRRMRAKLKSSDVLKPTGKKQPRADALKTADGFINQSGSAPRVTIRAEKFKKWYDDPRQPALVLRWLRSKNALPGRPALPAKSANAIVWAETQPLWPDGSRPRSIVIELNAGAFDQIKV
jgi:putative DNA primase/helicase